MDSVYYRFLYDAEFKTFEEWKADINLSFFSFPY